jgi:hypothetical protein
VTKRMFMVTLTLAVVALAAIAAPVSATTPTQVSGTYALAPSPPSYMRWQPAGENCKLAVGLTYDFVGDLAGKADFDYSIMVHGPCTADMPPGQGVYISNLKAKGTFTGEVLGTYGTFDFTYEGMEWPFEVSGDLGVAARIVILSGTDGLANLHGVLEVTYLVGDPYDTYSGHIHFDP